MSLSFKGTFIAEAGEKFLIKPKLAPWENWSAVTNPLDSIQASIWGIQTMVKNILENSVKEVWYPWRNAIVNYWYTLRHPIKTLNQDSFALVPKLVATPFTALASSFTGAIRSILNTPEDLAQWVWQTPIDATTAWTVWQLWAVWRWVHYAWKPISTTPRLGFNYTTSALGTGIDILWDTVAKVTNLDAVPQDKFKYVTPSSFTLTGNPDSTPIIAANSNNAVAAINADNAIVADSVREAA